MTFGLSARNAKPPAHFCATPSAFMRDEPATDVLCFLVCYLSPSSMMFDLQTVTQTLAAQLEASQNTVKRMEQARRSRLESLTSVASQVRYPLLIAFTHRASITMEHNQMHPS